MKDPHVAIQEIAEDLRGFVNNYTEYERYIAEYLGLAPLQFKFDAEDHESEIEYIKGENINLEEERDTLKELVNEGIREILHEHADKGFPDPISAINQIAWAIEEADTDICMDLNLIEKGILKSGERFTEEEARILSLENEIAELKAALSKAESSPKTPSNSQPERSGQPKASDPPKARKQKPAASGPPTLTRTPKGKALELRFDGIPEKSIRIAMSDHGFRWSRKREAWLAGYCEEALIYASHLAINGHEFSPQSQASEPETVTLPPSPTASPTVPYGFL